MKFNRVLSFSFVVFFVLLNITQAIGGDRGADASGVTEAARQRAFSMPMPISGSVSDNEKIFSVSLLARHVQSAPIPAPIAPSPSDDWSEDFIFGEPNELVTEEKEVKITPKNWRKKLSEIRITHDTRGDAVTLSDFVTDCVDAVRDLQKLKKSETLQCLLSDLMSEAYKALSFAHTEEVCVSRLQRAVCEFYVKLDNLCSQEDRYFPDIFKLPFEPKERKDVAGLYLESAVLYRKAGDATRGALMKMLDYVYAPHHKDTVSIERHEERIQCLFLQLLKADQDINIEHLQWLRERHEELLGGDSSVAAGTATSQE